MTIFFTADTHFGHANIIRLCNRPFESIEEMDDGLTARWNETVSENDTVYHLGDFSFRNVKEADQYRSRLNGEIHLLAGNHDGKTVKYHADVFASVSDILQLRLERRRMVLCHYPMREWHGAHRGWWHLFGHVHGGLDSEPLGYSMDVGVDSNDYRPISFDKIASLFEIRDNPFKIRA